MFTYRRYERLAATTVERKGRRRMYVRRTALLRWIDTMLEGKERCITYASYPCRSVMKESCC